MIRRLALALLLILAPGLAAAQIAFIAPTPPTADNGDRIATTAWANNFVNTGMPLASGKIWVGSVGNIAVAQTPAGDLTVSNAGAFTLATVNANVGTFGSATQCVTVTNNAKGLTTAISAATCTPAVGSITGLGTGIATALGVNVGTAGSPVVNGGVLGTPSSGVGTNLTALNATNLSSGTVAVARGGVDQAAWTSYSPTITCTVGTITTLGAVSGRYKLTTLKTVQVQVDAVITTVGTCAGLIKATIPFTAAAFNYVGVAKEVVLTGKSGVAQVPVSGTFMQSADSTGITFAASGAQVVFGMTYEVP